MSKNENKKTIIIMVVIAIVIIGLLTGFSNRLLSRNIGQGGQLGDGIRQLGDELEYGSGLLEDAHGGITESIVGVVDNRELIERTEESYIESSTGIDNQLKENRDSVEGLISGLDESGDLADIDTRINSRAREILGGIREILQELIDLEQD